VFLTGGTSFVVASPFLVPLAVRYRFHVRNELPTAFVWDELRNEHLARFAWDFGVRWPIVVGAGAAFLWWRRHRDRADDLRVTVLVTWTAAAFFALLLTCYGSGSLPGASAVPSVVPSYHWFLYLSAAMCVWFGIGSGAGTDLCCRFVSKSNTRSFKEVPWNGFFSTPSALQDSACRDTSSLTMPLIRSTGRSARFA